MPRTKGSKNKPKTVTADFATQIAEKQSAKETLTMEIASIAAPEYSVILRFHARNSIPHRRC